MEKTNPTEMAIIQYLLDIKKLKKKNNELILKETQTHNENVSLKSKIEELEEGNKRLKEGVKVLTEEKAKLFKDIEELEEDDRNTKVFVNTMDELETKNAQLERRLERAVVILEMVNQAGEIYSTDEEEEEEELSPKRPVSPKGMVETLKEENKKLKEEIKGLKKKNNELLLKETQTHNENVSLNSKIEELKEEIQGLEEEIAKWRRRMKTAEYWASEVIHYSHSASLDNLQAKKLITPDNKPTLADVRDFGEEITQLKEENEKLKEEVKDENTSFWEVFNENEKLKKKLEGMAEIGKLPFDVFEIFGDELTWEETIVQIKKLKELEKMRESVVEYLASDCENRIPRSTCCDWFNITLAEIEAVERMRTSDSEEEEDSDDGDVGSAFRKDLGDVGCDSHPDEQYA